MSDEKIVDVYADWDDPHAFRVFLAYETSGEGDIEYRPMRAEHFDGIEARLYRAAFRDCAKDVANQPVQQGPLGWATEAPAQRVAKAVKKELDRIEKAQPGPSDAAIQMALMLVPKRKAKR